MECTNCGNEYQLPERSATVPGGADHEYFYCEKCETYLGTVRVDGFLPPSMRGFGWVYGDRPTTEQRNMLNEQSKQK